MYVLIITAVLVFLPGQVVASSHTPEWREINEAYNRRDYTTSCNKALRLAERGDADAQTHVGLCYFEPSPGSGFPKDTQRGLAWLRRAADGGETIAMYRLMKIYRDGGGGVLRDATEAERWRQRHETAKRDQERAGFAKDYLALGNAKAQRNDFDGAIADYSKAIEYAPRDASAYFNRGFSRWRKGDHDGAIADYSQVIALGPRASDAYKHRAIAKESKGDHDGAMADYTKVIELDPKDARAYYDRAFTKVQKQDYDSAIADFTRAIDLEPKFAPAYYWRGQLRRSPREHDGAVADLTRAIELDPRYASAYAVRADIKRDAGNYDSAIDDYTKAIQLEPRHATAYQDRGLAKHLKGETDGALNDLDKVIEINSQFAGGYRSRGELRYDTGSWTDALYDFRKAIELDPQGQEDVRLRIWLVRVRLGERGAATRELKEYFTGRRRSQKPDDWVSRLAAFVSGDSPESALFKAAEAKDEQRSRNQLCAAYYYAGSKRLIAGDKETARRYFEKSVEVGKAALSEYRSALTELKLLARR